MRLARRYNARQPQNWSETHLRVDLTRAIPGVYGTPRIATCGCEFPVVIPSFSGLCCADVRSTSENLCISRIWRAQGNRKKTKTPNNTQLTLNSLAILALSPL